MIHPNLIVVGGCTETTYWRKGETMVIDPLKPDTERFILLSDDPWLIGTAQYLIWDRANQGTCLSSEGPLER